AVRLVGVDGAARQRQGAVFAVDAAAQGGARGVVDLVAVDERIGDRRVAAGGADAAPLGRRLVVVDGAGGDVQRALVGNAAADAGGVVLDVGANHRGRTEDGLIYAAAIGGCGVCAS